MDEFMYAWLCYAKEHRIYGGVKVHNVGVKGKYVIW